ncbi:MAG: tetratricopeptide repeat protein [Planctomycetaceae bacterium]|nr:tetratricopeptide repeat protein [Planctomycetaceae bacterium]
MFPARLLAALLSLFLFLLRPSLGADPVSADAAPKGKAAEHVVTTADVPLMSEQIRELMQDRKFADAVAVMDAAAREEGAPKDYLAYLKGRALYLDKKYDEAVAAFGLVQKTYSQSAWLQRAQFGEALAYARKGEFEKAEAIYRRQAESLLSEDRKQEIAEIYLEFAQKYFEPPKKPDAKPDYEKALVFYQKALEVGPKPEERQRIELQIGRCHQELGRNDEAVKLYRKFLEDHKKSPLDVEVRFRLGQVELAMGQLNEARRTWQDLLAEHVDSSSERVAEAMFLLSRTWQIPQPQDDKQLSLGVAALEAFLKRFPDHEKAAEAQLDIARSYIHRGQFEEAVARLKGFIADQRYQKAKEVAEARNLLGHCYQLQKKFTEALAAWQEYLSKHPAHEAWSAVQQQIVNTEYLMAEEARQEKKYDKARELWNAFSAKYPLDPRNPQILYWYGEMLYQQEKWQPAIDEWRGLVSKYPGSNEASRGQLMIAATLESKLGKLAEALEEYKKLNWGPMQPSAQQAIARLTAKSLTVATERIFRSNETPVIKLTSRNLETVTVRAYKVDMETYFRKMHLARGVEKLDIALIDPDTTFEFKVPGYTEYQQIESTAEVPLPDKATAGVMAVTVSSKTLEATTLIVQSDLDIIAKSSRDEVFVLAENMVTGKPWPGVRLLISDGQEVFAEATTGDDGVLHKSFKELGDAADVRVFAVMEGNVASNVVGLEGVGVAKGLTDRGYLYTDRPAYRAGDLVHVRGCVRLVTDDRYTVPAGKKYKLQAFDPRNRMLREEEVVLGPFGTFHAHFPLPQTSPQGEYRVLLADDSEHQYQGTFVVQEYKLEPVHLVIDTPRHVCYRGEKIEGTIRAEFYHGAPLAGRQIVYQLAGQRTHTATTDEKGEVKFELATREFMETQTLPFVVTLPERNLARAVNFFLSAQGFDIGLETVRPVYVAGESFEVSLTTKDAEGKPIAKKLTLRVLQRTKVDGKVGERLVEEHALETDKDGKARQTLTLAEGGDYVCRAFGTDRFENVVTGEHVVKISDDKDQVRLRILADRHTFKVGDTAKVNVHWREEPALALVTFQGAKILDYRLVTLENGANALEIPMGAELAPNFELAVAVMTDPKPKADEKNDDKPIQRFHTASSPFSVQRELRVEISSKRTGEGKGPVRPGEEIEVTVKTTDPQGKPVAAELSLAMIEKSLLDRFPSSVAAISDFFRGNLRESAVRTTSSITFSYNPSTRPINPRLLAEWNRLEVAAEEAESRSELAGAVSMEESEKLDALIVSPSVDPFGATASQPAPAPYGPPAAPTGQSDWQFGLELNLPASRRAELRAKQPARARGQMQAGGEAEQFSFFLGFQRDAGVVGGIVVDEESLARGAQYGTYSAGDRVSAGGYAARRVAEEGAESYYYTPANADDLVRLGRENVAQIRVLQRDGTEQAFTLGGRADFDVADAKRLAGRLGEAGAMLLPDAGMQETGYWNPAVVTGDDGMAKVTFTVPEHSTAWSFAAKGITTETLAGEATSDLTVKKDLFGELKLPLAFTDGDKAEVLATVHNDAVEKGRINVTLKTTIAGRSVSETKTIDATAKGLHEASFSCELRRPEGEQVKGTVPPQVDVEFELTVAAESSEDGTMTDVVRQTVPLKPYGMPVYATAGGSATSDMTAWIEAPKDMPLASPSLQILIGPTVERSLVDVVLGPAPRCQLEIGRLASGTETATSDLLASLGIQKLLSGSRESAGPTTQAIDQRIRSTVSVLVSSQNDDGGWSWTGRGGASDRYASARALWALALAKKGGYKVAAENFDKAVGYVTGQIAATGASDLESKAILLHALTVAGHEDFALANRLHRSRPVLSPAALAYTALAFAAMDRNDTAKELADALATKNLDQPANLRTAADGLLPLSGSPTELRALYALLLVEIEPTSDRTREVTDWLMSHRTGHRWTPEKATGTATLALSDWYARSRFEGEKYQLTVVVNEKEAAVLEVEPSAITQTVDVPGELLVDGKQRVEFHIAGRGRYTYQCILGGFVPADKLKSTTNLWEVRRYYQPAPLERDGKAVPRGFDVLTGSYNSFRNPLTQLPVARRGNVELHVWRQNVPGNTPNEQLEYLVITEPIPCGATVVADSVKGPFERYEIGPGEITFYVGNRQGIGTIQYDLLGYLPGEYRCGPTVIRDAYRPGDLRVGELKGLKVLPMGAESADEYRLTPRELFELGKIEFAAGQMEKAQKHLEELVEKWNLTPEVYKAAVTTLFDSYLATGVAERIVHYFEIVREKWPAENIPFEKILKVGTAYEEMGEFERSYLVFRATIESSFSRESSVAGFLQSQGEFLRSVDVMGQLLRQYPPEAYIAAAEYAFAQRVYAKAPAAAEDAKLREQKVNRVDLIQRAWRMLEGFLTAYPDDPAADQAAFAAANTLLDIDAYDRAAEACGRYAGRYPKSDLIDAFWYVIGYCRFAMGNHAEALEMCGKVAEAKRVDPATGNEKESDDKWRAIYILGQIHHSLGEAAEAVKEYRRVEDRFPDAKQSIEYFTRKEIEIPEVTTVEPDKPVEVELKYRNIPECDTKVYRIDLMKFGLMKRDLQGITQINLAGIRPYHEATIKLGDGKDYRDCTKQVALPLKEDGAYLVVCRGENLYASGLVLVTPLAIEVQEDAVSGQVRTTVKDREADRYLRDVHVKAIGSRNDEFVSGETDLRGVFVADSIRGTSTVIAQAESSHYAFFRGKTELVPEVLSKERKAEDKAPLPAQPAPATLKQQLLEGVQFRNSAMQQEQVQQLEDMYQAPAKGVEASKALK